MGASLELKKRLRAVFPEKEVLRVAGLSGLRVYKLRLPVLVNLNVFDKALSSSLVLELQPPYDSCRNIGDVKHLDDEAAPAGILLEQGSLLI